MFCRQFCCSNVLIDIFLDYFNDIKYQGPTKSMINTFVCVRRAIHQAEYPQIFKHFLLYLTLFAEKLR